MDYISREAIIQFGEKQLKNLDDGEAYRRLDAWLNFVPAADVLGAKCGKWIYDGYWSNGCGMGEEYGNYWKCSVCDKIVQEDYAKCGFYYCPNCGADMREKQT